MIINVTQQDIDSGVKGNPSKCAIAQALKRMLNDIYLEVNVFHTSLHLNGKKYRMPQKGTDFVFLFDTPGDKSSKPVEIEIYESENDISEFELILT
jgi:hypothetical protein